MDNWISLAGSLAGSALGVVASARLLSYRVGQLEKKVEKHNTIVERTFKLEGRVNALEDKVKETSDEVREMVK